jgi:hypothetical protein
MFRNLNSGTIRSAALTALAVGAIGGTSALAALPHSPAPGNSPKVQQETPQSPGTSNKPATALACQNNDQGETADPAAKAKHDADESKDELDDQGDKADAPAKAQHDAKEAAEEAEDAAEDLNDEDGKKCDAPAKPEVPAAPGVTQSPAVKPSESPTQSQSSHLHQRPAPMSPHRRNLSTHPPHNPAPDE